MANTIDPKAFSGHKGYVVEDTNNDGVLGPEDKVRKLVKDNGIKGRVEPGDQVGDTDVAWDDPGFADARRDFVDVSGRAQNLLDAVGAVSADIAKTKAGAGPMPPEAKLTSIAEQARRMRDSDASPALRARAEIALSAASGLVAGEYRTGMLNKKAPGTEAYQMARGATDLAPDSTEAWGAHAIAYIGTETAVAGESGTKFFMKLGGIDLDGDATRLVKGLSRFPKDPGMQLLLVAVLDARGVDLSAAEAATRTKVKADIETLRQAHPAAVAEAEKALAERLAGVRKAVDSAKQDVNKT